METISALMDGELDQEDAASLIPALKQREDLRETWAAYHLIGDALRGQHCGDCGVAGVVAAQLSREPTVLAPRSARSGSTKRWALPSLAAAAAVATVTWMSMETQQGGAGPQITVPAGQFLTTGHNVLMPTVATATGSPIQEITEAAGPYTPANPPAPPIQFSGRELQPYLMAHQEFSPSTTIQGLAPYVRTVTSTVIERY